MSLEHPDEHGIPGGAPASADAAVPLVGETGDGCIGTPLDFPAAVESAGTVANLGELTGGDRQILDTEKRTWRSPAAKDLFITIDLGMTPTRYYQILNRLIDTPAAFRYDPSLVNQLRERRRTRAARRTGQAPGAAARRNAHGR